MADITFGWFDLVYWLVAFAVAYYVAFVIDIRKLFSKTKKEDRSKIKIPKASKDKSLTLEKVLGICK